MLNYGGSITSAFPNTFCSSPNSVACQLCNKPMNESSLASSNSNSYLYYNQQQKKNPLAQRSDRCIHCGINICEKCLNENQEKSPFNHFKSTEAIDDTFSKSNRSFILLVIM